MVATPAAKTWTSTSTPTPTQTPKLKSFAPLLLVLTLLFFNSCSCGSGNRIRAGKNQIPSCCDMSSEIQCSQNPNCRWCRSESLDDMCFSKSEALRLPPEVFTCKLFRFSQKF